MLQTGFELAQNLISGFLEESCAVVITTTPQCQNMTSKKKHNRQQDTKYLSKSVYNNFNSNNNHDKDFNNRINDSKNNGSSNKNNTNCDSNDWTDKCVGKYILLKVTSTTPVPHPDVFRYNLNSMGIQKKSAQKSSCNSFAIYISCKN